MGVDEACDEQEGTQGVCVSCRSPAVTVLQPGDYSVCDEWIASEAAVGEWGTMGFGAYPTGKAEGVERIGCAVCVDGFLVDLAGGVVGCKNLAGVLVDQVGVGDVPLAVVMGVVAAGPEPVTERGYLAGTQPT